MPFPRPGSHRDEQKARLGLGAAFVHFGLAVLAAQNSTTALQCGTGLVNDLLRMKTVEASARRLAAATAALGAGGGEAAGVAPAVSTRSREQASIILCNTFGLLTSIARITERQHSRAACEELLRILRRCHILKHAARLILVLMPPPPADHPPGAGAAPAAPAPAHAPGLSSLQRYVKSLFMSFLDVFKRLDDIEVDGLALDEARLVEQHAAVRGPITRAAVAEAAAAARAAGCVQLQLGPIARYGLLALGLCALDAADGLGTYGLPPGRLPVVPQLEPSSGAMAGRRVLEPDIMSGFVSVIDRDVHSTDPVLSRRMTVLLLWRVGRLMLASIQARAGGPARSVTGSAAVVRLPSEGTDGAGGSMEATYHSFVFLEQAAGLLANLCFDTWRLTEMAATWRLVLALACEMGPFLDREQSQCLRVTLQGMINDLALPTSGEDEERMLLPMPAVPPPCVAAALAGGLVPGLERLLRRTGSDSEAPTYRLACGVLFGNALAWAMRFGNRRQLLCLFATLAKRLRRMDPQLMLRTGELYNNNHNAVQAALSLLPTALRQFGGPALPARESTATAAAAASQAAEQAGPSGSAPPLPTRVPPPLLAAFTVLRLLPPLSRLVREAALRRWLRVLASASLGHTAREPGSSGSAAAAAAAASASPDATASPSANSAAAAVETGVASPPSSAAAAAASGEEWRAFLLEEVRVVPLLGAVLALIERRGRRALDMPQSLTELAEACCAVAAAFPAEVALAARRAGSGDGNGNGSGGGSSSGDGSGSGSAPAAAFPWRPEALRLLAWQLVVCGADDAAAARVTALAAALERGAGGGAELSGIDSWYLWDPEVGPQVRALCAVRPSEARALLPPCANPNCFNIAGDSEAELKLQRCGKCKSVSYCCRECQMAHWRAGHKEACGAAVTTG
ncbi:hypothetical protein HYH03_007164 [Edaphochlamys debaryana]|uniref:phytol kinase n=1 Tax=Edaphochlamys debaryana TaxID=47281 RepID=A0A835Y4M9_9CHLO|nr:hypothetical protein HYH03_007164 [Edaphochlamys debaryana]|eukprot:KAG2494648.1 hypothetical protein HYH03_007164 [Edaphochlamys debaryana]